MKFEELFQPKPGSVAAEMQKTINGLNKEIKELRAENAALRKAKEMVELERCEMMRSMSLAQNQSQQLRADKDRLDFLSTLTGSGWACLHLDQKGANDDWFLTRKQIDRRMATEPKQ